MTSTKTPSSSIRGRVVSMSAISAGTGRQATLTQTTTMPEMDIDSWTDTETETQIEARTAPEVIMGLKGEERPCQTSGDMMTCVRVAGTQIHTALALREARPKAEAGTSGNAAETGAMTILGGMTEDTMTSATGRTWCSM